MYVSVFFKTLFVGCVLYSTFADAKLADVTSVVSSLVERSFAGHKLSNQAKRFKRDVTTKTLDDPKQCIYTCNQNETKMIISATMKNMAKLVAIALQDVDFTGDETETPEKKEAFKKQIEQKTIDNMGPFFDDLCTVATKTDECYSFCPESQLRKIISLTHNDAVAFCEPKQNWPNFTVYWNAINCTNATEDENPCDKKCGTQQDIRNVTNLKVEDPEEDGTEIKYEKDIKKNTEAVGPVCQTVLCDINCYKPIMTEKCGAKAYELYARLSKIDPRAALSILKELNAVDENKDCRDFE